MRVAAVSTQSGKTWRSENQNRNTLVKRSANLCINQTRNCQFTREPSLKGRRSFVGRHLEWQRRPIYTRSCRPESIITLIKQNDKAPYSGAAPCWLTPKLNWILTMMAEIQISFSILQVPAVYRFDRQRRAAEQMCETRAHLLSKILLKTTVNKNSSSSSDSGAKEQDVNPMQLIRRSIIDCYPLNLHVAIA